jgi:hypothetical protein
MMRFFVAGMIYLVVLTFSGFAGESELDFEIIITRTNERLEVLALGTTQTSVFGPWDQRFEQIIIEVGSYRLRYLGFAIWHGDIPLDAASGISAPTISITGLHQRSTVSITLLREPRSPEGTLFPPLPAPGDPLDFPVPYLFTSTEELSENEILEIYVVASHAETLEGDLNAIWISGTPGSSQVLIDAHHYIDPERNIPFRFVSIYPVVSSVSRIEEGGARGAIIYRLLPTDHMRFTNASQIPLAGNRRTIDETEISLPEPR